MSSPPPFSLDLDHVVIFVSPDAPEAQSLERLGIQSFGGITHHGHLGTASTSFFFENTYLELFWAHDAAQAQATLQPAGIDIASRVGWRQNSASPFGLMLCRQLGSIDPIPFATRQLRAEWMPGDVTLHFAGDEPAEPYYGVVPEQLAYRSFKTNIPDMAHPPGMRRLTAIRIAAPITTPSAIARLLTEHGLASIEAGAEPIMELTFDRGAQDKQLDVRPTLPLVLKY